MKLRYYLVTCFLLSWSIVHAQLSQYEYWFDNEFSKRVTRSIGGSSASINELDAANLSNGVHHWYLRIKDVNGNYSGITSGVFFKCPPGTDSKIEYWFNDDFEDMKTVPLDGNSDITVIDDLLDVSNMSFGLNRFYLRTSAGTIYSSYFLKTVAGTADRLEYWYNDDFENRKPVSLTKTDSVIMLDDFVNVQDMPFGINRFHLRTAESTIYSSYVLKTVEEAANKLEYWYNDDFENKTAVSLSKDSDVTVIDDLMDVRNMPFGLNRFHLRTSEGTIYSSYFLKTVAGAADQLEYWYNDDFEHRKLVTLTKTDSVIMLDDRVNVQDMPFGINRFHLRTAEGTIYSSYVLKTVAGATNKLIYWFDDDYDNRQIIYPEVYSDEISIVSSIDASALSEGSHQIHFRAVSNREEHNPIITEFFFKGNSTNQGNYEVTHAKYWVDNNKSQSVTVPVNDSNLNGTVITTIMDANAVPAGNHSLNLQIANSAGMWSAVETSRFNKMIYENDSIELEVSITDKNNVLLKWNTIPSIAYYKVFVNYTAISDIYKHESHPVTVKKEISVPKGRRYFQIKAYDASDKVIHVSNEVMEIVPGITELKGSLTAYVRDSNGALIENVKFINNMKTDIFYNDDPESNLVDGREEKTEYGTSQTGQYDFQVPYFTSGTVNAEKEGYLITPGINFRYRIDEQNPNTVVTFNAIKVGESEDDYSPELEMASEMQNLPIDDDGYIDVSSSHKDISVTVKNITGELWKGWVALKIGTGTNEMKTYYSSNSPRVYLELLPQSGRKDDNFSGEMTITFLNVPTAMFPANSTQINVSLYSLRKMSEVATLPPKLIKPTKNYANPYGVYTVDDGQPYLAAYQDALNEALLDVVSTLKQVESVHKFLSSAHNQFSNSDLGDILGGLKNYNEGLRMTQGILTNATDYFQKDPEIIQFLGKLAKQGKTVEAIRKFLNGEYMPDMKNITIPYSYTELKHFILRKLPGMEDDEFEPTDFFTIIKTISHQAPAPVKAVFEPLFTVGSAYLDEISDIQKFIFDKMDEGRIGLIDKEQYIKIEVKNKTGDKFTSKDIAASIESVKVISTLNGPNGSQHTMNYKFDDVANNNFAKYKMSSNGLSAGSYAYCSLIQILWKNGRITWVPVSSKFVSPDIKADTYTVTVKFKSENSLAKHLADKLTIQPPS